MVGHSYGGIVALAWGLQAPLDITGLMLVSPVCMPMEEKVDAILRVIARPTVGPVVAKLICSILRKKAAAEAIAKAFSPNAIPKGYMEHIGNSLLTNPYELRNNAREIAALKIYLPKLSAKYSGLDVPIEILHGTQDSNLPASEHSDVLAKILPDARYSQLEGIGHMPHYHAVSRILEVVARLTEQAA